MNIASYLPEGVSLVGAGTGNITVTAVIEQDGTRTIDFLVSSIIMNNLSEDLQVSYEPGAEISLTFLGDQDRLDVLDISNAVSVDLGAYTKPGTYNVPVSVDLPEGITLSSDVTVKLELKAKSDDSEEQTGSDSSSDQNAMQDEEQTE